MRSAWDRRLVLHSCYKLKAYREQRVYVWEDEPLETRRQKIFERIRNKAEKDGKVVAVVENDVLLIDNMPVYSLSHGNIGPH